MIKKLHRLMVWGRQKRITRSVRGAGHVVVQVLVSRRGHARRGGDAGGRSQATKRWGLGAGSRHEGLAAIQEKNKARGMSDTIVPAVQPWSQPSTSDHLIKQELTSP